jgi:hypothetical protein
MSRRCAGLLSTKPAGGTALTPMETDLRLLLLRFAPVTKDTRSRAHRRTWQRSVEGLGRRVDKGRGGKGMLIPAPILRHPRAGEGPSLSTTCAHPNRFRRKSSAPTWPASGEDRSRRRLSDDADVARPLLSGPLRDQPEYGQRRQRERRGVRLVLPGTPSAATVPLPISLPAKVGSSVFSTSTHRPAGRSGRRAGPPE